jgi:RpiB/LacA/LacB family sugar-phosphate isomerase
MRIVVASDHAGLPLKAHMLPLLRGMGHEVLDVGTHTADAVDYPDYAAAGCRAVLDGRAERGILFCGSGVGMSIAANKIPGIRAGNVEDHYSAHQGVEHDDMNVLVLGGRTMGTAVAEELVRAFVAARFTGEDRHARRLAKVLEIERNPGQFAPERPSAGPRAAGAHA